jgi:hypothetical protein
MIVKRCNDIERQAKTETREKICTYILEEEWGRGLYTSCYELNERNAVACFRLGMWKMRGLRKGAERGRCPLREEGKDESHILLKCKEMKGWTVTILQQEMSKNKKKMHTEN